VAVLSNLQAIGVATHRYRQIVDQSKVKPLTLDRETCSELLSKFTMVFIAYVGGILEGCQARGIGWSESLCHYLIRQIPRSYNESSSRSLVAVSGVSAVDVPSLRYA
jgi:hypothetical protein